jgi:uncharacterized membrane-anchored protein YjiN (DUF445 family)
MTDALKKLNIKKVISDKNLWNEIGETQVQNTRGSQVLGKGAAQHGGNLEKFDDLAISTIKQRRYEKLSNLTKPAKSNLIETGQMLSDLTHEVGREDVTIKHRTMRSKEIASYHHEATGTRPARPFMNMSKSNIKAVKNIFLKYLDKIFKGDR